MAVDTSFQSVDDIANELRGATFHFTLPIEGERTV